VTLGKKQKRPQQRRDESGGRVGVGNGDGEGNLGQCGGLQKRAPAKPTGMFSRGRACSRTTLFYSLCATPEGVVSWGFQRISKSCFFLVGAEQWMASA
jgi:hypothetical protein